LTTKVDLLPKKVWTLKKLDLRSIKDWMFGTVRTGTKSAESPWV
jgi:hypothetical protein